MIFLVASWTRREREREALVGEKLGSDATTMMNEHELSLV
jgi:hypothetical protein